VFLIKYLQFNKEGKQRRLRKDNILQLADFRELPFGARQYEAGKIITFQVAF
jgi:hypothetical protein